MSAFRAGGREFGKARKLTDVLLYKYDFGSTAEILITVVDKIKRAKKKEKVQLLSQNVPAQEKCEACGAPAAYIDITEGANFCGSEDTPRCGECSYDGELDIWTFDPNKPFPQPQNAAAHGYRRIRYKQEKSAVLNERGRLYVLH